jgi:flagellar biosynthesis/type III secretory pathway protein FliH
VEVHCFPDLQPCGHEAGNNGDQTCALFQPLFKQRGEGFERSAAHDTNGANTLDPSISDGTNLKELYEKGFSGGQNAAACALHEELVPHIHNFETSLQGLFKEIDGLLSSAGEDIAGLALAITEKILGRPLQTDASAYDSLKEQIQIDLDQAYRMELSINPDDFDMLNDLMGDSLLSESNGGERPLKKAGDVERGTIRVAEKQLLLDDRQIEKIVSSSEF